MIIHANGRDYLPQDLLMYWIREREQIRIKKELGHEKPWSTDPVFQETYFCNVHREDDRVTRWIRSFYSPHVEHPLFEFNIILSRFLNWPDTLAEIGYLTHDDPIKIMAVLTSRAARGVKVWGGAYVITTHGIPMGKAEYLVDNVLGAVRERIDRLRHACRGPSCGAAAAALEEIEGIGSFLAGQIVADLKNTVGHPLAASIDRASFVVPGPGSLRGLSWIFYGEPKGVTEASFKAHFDKLRLYLDMGFPEMQTIDNQDLQNCLCEFDKYCRVTTGTGRSKRKYAGI